MSLMSFATQITLVATEIKQSKENHFCIAKAQIVSDNLLDMT